VEELEHLEAIIERVFLWGLVWSFGCTTNLEGRKKFDLFLRELALKKKLKGFPEEQTVYDYEFK
jgi:hypothetical protein